VLAVIHRTGVALLTGFYSGLSEIEHGARGSIARD
jgi:hypothetical protein